MSDALVPTLTRAGLAAVARAQGDGLQAVIASVAVGRGVRSGSTFVGYVPLKAATALVTEVARVPLISGSRLDPAGFRVQALVPAAPEYAIREVGFFLETGELFCLWSSPAFPLAYVTPLSDVDLALDLYIEQIPTELLNIKVTRPDIPDTTGVLAGLLSCEIRTLIADINQERRLIARGIY